MWLRHWMAAFMKHVLPRLFSPTAPGVTERLATAKPNAGYARTRVGRGEESKTIKRDEILLGDEIYTTA